MRKWPWPKPPREAFFVLVSGYTDVIVDWRFVQEKGYRFLQKPYVLPNLLQTLRELLESQN